jgi:hypothetical protein
MIDTQTECDYTYLVVAAMLFNSRRFALAALVCSFWRAASASAR